MATPQDTCQRCKVTMPEIALISATAPGRVWRLPLKIPGIFVGASLIIVGLLLVFPAKKGSAPPQMLMTPAAQAVSEQTSSAPLVPAKETAPATPVVTAVQEITVASAPETSAPPVAATPVSAPAPPPEVAASATSALARYFVNNDGLSIREGPDTSASLLGTLNFKEEVELLETSGGWGKVRDVRRNIVGWSYMRYLDPIAVDGPRTVPRLQPGDPKKPEAITAKAVGDM